MDELTRIEKKKLLKRHSHAKEKNVVAKRLFFYIDNSRGDYLHTVLPPISLKSIANSGNFFIKNL